MSVSLGGYLIAVDFVVHDLRWIPPVTMRPSTIVVERPVIYRDTRNPNNVLDVAWEAALLVGWLTLGRTYPGRELVEYTPQEWKGQLAKPPHHAAMWDVLTPQERELFPGGTQETIDKACTALAFGRKPSYAGRVVDLLDAGALNLFHCGRLPKNGKDPTR